MDAHNRIKDVVKLRCNACQDFIKLIIKDGWNNVLYEKAKYEVEHSTKLKEKYISVFEKMRDIDASNYTVDMMDVTLINTILYDCPQIAEATKRTKTALFRLTQDRNLTDHSNENETDEEIYLRGLLDLCDLQIFIRTVDKEEINICDSLRKDYRQKYIMKIEELKNLLDEERIDLVHKYKEYDHEIKSVLNSQNPHLRWSELNIQILKKYWGEENNPDLYYELLNRAVDAGVQDASIAMVSFLISVKKDYLNANKELAKLLSSKDRFPNHEMHSIISIVNDFIRDEQPIGNELIQLIEQKSETPIIKMDNGFYSIKSSNKKAE